MKKYVCMKSECREQVLCWECHRSQSQHQDAVIDYMLGINQNEVEALLNEAMDESKQ